MDFVWTGGTAPHVTALEVGPSGDLHADVCVVFPGFLSPACFCS